MALTKAQLIDLNANEMIIDLDGDTSITADTDDQIDIKIAGADDFRFTANTFTALSGSTIAAQALTATTIAVSNDGTIGSAGDADAIAISSAGVVTFSQSPVFPDGSLAVVDLDIDGATDIGANLADADLLVVDDGAGGTNRKSAMSRVKTYIADVTLTTAAQTNITSVGTLTALTVDDMTLDGSTISDSGDFTIDGGADIILDADGGDIFFKDGGTTFGSATNTSGNLIIKSGTTTAATFSGANVTLAGTVGSGAITSTGIVTGTGFTAGSAVLAEAELELLDGLTAGTAIASKVVTTDANIDTTGQRNLTITGELDAATLDISGDADIDGTLEADAITINGTTLAETIADTVGAMVSSNTESNITVTYDDADNTLDFSVSSSLDTTGNAATATALETARTIHGVSFDGTANIDLSEVISDTVGAMFSSNTETGITVTYQDADNTIDFAIGSQAIVNSMLADDAVGADELAASAVVTASIVDDSVTQAKIADDAVGADQLASDAVVNASIASSAAIADSKLATISTAGKVALTSLEIDGGTDIGADLTTSDLIVVDDGAGGTNRKAALSRVVTLMTAQGFVTDDPTALAIALG